MLSRVDGFAEGLVFVDAAQVQINHTPWAGAGDENVRTLAGAGVGLNWSRDGLTLEVLAAAPVGDVPEDAGGPWRGWARASWLF